VGYLGNFKALFHTLSLIAVTFNTVSVYDCIAEWRKATQVRVTMSKSEIGERDKYVKETISDGICDLLETLHYQDKSVEKKETFIISLLVTDVVCQI